MSDTTPMPALTRDGDAVAALSRSTGRGLYLIEGTLLGLFMVSACAFTALFEHPASPLSALDPILRRAGIGLAMGVTAVGLIYSPWGKRSGAHMNPAVTLSFFRLGKLTRRDAAGYVAGQFVGSAIGVGLCALALGGFVADPAVNYVITTPGRHGWIVAWAAEFAIAFLMLAVVLLTNRRPRLRAFTGVFAGLLVAAYITVEAPLSGMSLNPARTFGSSLIANVWTAWWVYFTAPVAGMLAAIELLRLAGVVKLCGKFTHHKHAHIRCNCEQESA